MSEVQLTALTVQHCREGLGRAAVGIPRTVHRRPGAPARGPVWCTLFDARRPRPFQHKITRDAPSVPSGAWIAIGDDATLGPGHTEGTCGEASWALRFAATEPEL